MGQGLVQAGLQAEADEPAEDCCKPTGKVKGKEEQLNGGEQDNS